MKYKLCAAIKADGTPCRSLVSPGKHRCHYHWDFDLRERRRQRALIRRHSPVIRLGPLADRPAILRALNRLLPVIADGSMPLEHSDRLLQRIHLASISLPPMTAAAQSCCRNRKV
jgi:hypothetical protein